MNRPLIVSIVAVFSACGTPNTTLDGGSNGKAPTYYKDVLPITQKSCNGCHVAGGIAPFALDSYEGAQSHAAVMANATQTKRMPPWLASAECGGPFVGDRSLSDAEIATLTDWANGGTPMGDEADKPAPIDLAGELLPRTDFEAKMPAAYTPTQRDDYRCFIIDPQLAAQKTVIGYDITPGSRKVVHHVIMYVVPRTKAAAKDAEDQTAGWECFGGANTTTTGTIGAWAPGGSAVQFPTNTGIVIGKDSVIAMQVHYNTDNATEADQTSVKLMYGTGAERQAVLIPIVADQFEIPANAVGYKHTESFPNNYGLGPIKVWGMLPHMHTKGTKISLQGDGDACLVDIKRWDFHWQSQYFRKTAAIVPNGSKLTINCEWDNPTNASVYWGEGTAQEMCFAFVYATL